MSGQKKITDQIKGFQQLENQEISLDEKLDELLILLENSQLDTKSISKIQKKFNTVANQQINKKNFIGELQSVSTKEMDGMEKLEQLEILLNNNYLDSKETKKIRLSERLAQFVQIIIGFLMVALGFAMVVLPAPPYFEMFTIFHFTYDDGFTLMDLISLIIIATGIYIVIKSYFKLNH